jgi:hypothetical protein
MFDAIICVGPTQMEQCFSSKNWTPYIKLHMGFSVQATSVVLLQYLVITLILAPKYSQQKLFNVKCILS